MNIQELERAFNLRKESPSARRTFISAAVKGIDIEKRTIRAYASTKAWDRYGERFEADAFKDGLANFKKNPVILFAHDYSAAPVAKAIDYEFDANGLILTMKFADTEKANEVFALYEGGFMSAFSVGFRPLEYRFEERVVGSGEMGAVFVKAELLENSAVPVPANPEAVVIKGLQGKTMTLTADTVRDLISGSFRAGPFSRGEEDIAPAGDPEAAAPAAEPAAEAPAPAEPTPEEVPKSFLKSMMGCMDHLDEAMSLCDQMMSGKAAAAPEMMELKAHLSAAKVECDAAMGPMGKIQPIHNLKAALGYLIQLGRAQNGKVTDDGVRSLLIQANNLCRELVYGRGVESLDGMDAEPTGEQIAALVREYEVLSETIARSGKATPKDITEFKALGDYIEGIIKKGKI